VEGKVGERSEEARIDRLMEYTLEIQTVPGIADSEYLDRLAEFVYELPELIDPFLALSEDGSVSANFCVVGTSPVRAAEGGVAAFVHACAEARPLREPTAAEVTRSYATASSLAEAADAEASVVGSFAVSRAADRQVVPA
jgi:hypothetical protein